MVHCTLVEFVVVAAATATAATAPLDHDVRAVLNAVPEMGAAQELVLILISALFVAALLMLGGYAYGCFDYVDDRHVQRTNAVQISSEPSVCAFVWMHRVVNAVLGRRDAPALMAIGRV